MNGERERGKKGARRDGKGFRFPNAGSLCHDQIIYSCRKHITYLKIR